MLLFADYQVYVTTDEQGGHAKASGGKRILRTTHSPSWDAKNRVGLPEVMDLDIEPLLPHFTNHLTDRSVPIVVPASVDAKIPANKPGPTPSEESLTALMARDGVSPEELSAVVDARGYQPVGTPMSAYPEDFRAWLIEQWVNVREAVEINRIEVPFGTGNED